VHGPVFRRVAMEINVKEKWGEEDQRRDKWTEQSMVRNGE